MTLPIEFEQRMQRLLGAEYPAFRAAMDQPQARGLRVNSLKITPEQFAAQSPFPLTPIPWAEEGFFYPETVRPGRHPYYEAGAYYIQEPSAMAVGTLADVQPGENVLDLCAAPGGKTTHLAGRMHGEGLIVANEINVVRCKTLAQSVERMGIANCMVTNETPERLAQWFPRFFDKIIVDAPCSGEGMFRKDDNPAQSEWTPELPAACAKRQANILDCAAKMLRGGGTLVYSTCTFAPEENEGTISRFLERHTDFSMVQVEHPPAQLSPARPDWVEHCDPSLAHAFRLWPHRLNGEGHFIAVMRKHGGQFNDPTRISLVPTKKQMQELEPSIAYLRDIVKSLPEGCIMTQGDRLMLIPEACQRNLTNARVRSYGLELGTIKKNRVEPSHALSHALPLSDFRRVCDLPPDDENIMRYLRGESFPFDGEKGWTAVAAGGFVLGWGKCVDGVMKNHYPKGLRWVGK